MVRVYWHGGVSGRPTPHRPAHDVAAAAARGSEVAVDAVEATVRALEDDPVLNAGYGAVLNSAGRIELDAGIAEGSGRCGSVAGVAVRHPISLARYVMEHTPHVFMAGAGATHLGRRAGFEELAASTPEQHERWRRKMSGAGAAGDYGRADQVETVGAVALDSGGNLSAGSSTGGVWGQEEGRVGDSAVFGAGFYAAAGAAVVGTGLGELFIQTLACARVGVLLAEGLPPQDACESVLESLAAARPAPAGLLALDAEGRVGAAYRGASWAVAGPDGVLEARCVGPAGG
jgi:beta-aspartyl-peptidase (threonine type)